MRGEYGPYEQQNQPASELPPHARRIRLTVGETYESFGTTSACAENTAPRHSRKHLRWNYLRMRGEYRIRLSMVAGAWELPPRARRIHQAMVKPHQTGGTTSACAENTRYQLIIKSYNRNYLRMRGEYDRMDQYLTWGEELPPHARRIQVRACWWGGLWGTTSACAENTLIGCPPPLARGNYLRMRGEYDSIVDMIETALELPPHARRIPL